MTAPCRSSNLHVQSSTLMHWRATACDVINNVKKITASAILHFGADISNTVASKSEIAEHIYRNTQTSMHPK